MPDMLDVLQEQERTLIFESFTNKDALRIGNAIVEYIGEQSRAATVEISVNGWQIFKHAMDGTRPENDRWINRKRNMLHYRNTSTLFAQKFIARQGRDIETDLFLDPKEFSVAGGAFPINLQGRVIGSIIVSGLTDVEDHQVVVDVLCAYLRKSVPSVLAYV